VPEFEHITFWDKTRKQYLVKLIKKTKETALRRAQPLFTISLTLKVKLSAGAKNVLL